MWDGRPGKCLPWRCLIVCIWSGYAASCCLRCIQSTTGAGLIASQRRQRLYKQGWPVVPTVARIIIFHHVVHITIVSLHLQTVITIAQCETDMLKAHGKTIVNHRRFRTATVNKVSDACVGHPTRPARHICQRSCR
jgi:hypothetical protein